MAVRFETCLKQACALSDFDEIKARVLQAAEQTPDGETAELSLTLDHGAYVLSSPFTLSARECPALSKVRLHIKSALGMRPIVTSLAPICGKDFVRQEGKEYYVYRFSKGADGKYPFFRDLYVNGERLTPARSVSFINPYPLTPQERRGEVKKKGLYLPMDAVREMLASEGAIYFTLHVEWECFTMRVTGADLTDTREENGVTYVLVTFRDEFDFFVRAVNGCINIGNREGYFWGGVDYLTPHGFVYDHENGLLYYRPKDGTAPASLDFRYPTLETLFHFEGLRGVTLDGISFTGTTSKYVFENGYFSGQANTEKRAQRLPHAAVVGDGMRDFTVKDCAFRFLGGNGLLLREGATNVRVTGCEFYDIGMSALSVGNPSAKWEEERNRNFAIHIENNSLTRVAYTYPTSVAAYFGVVDGLRFLHNTVKDTAYSAFSAGWFSIEDFTLGERVNLRDAEIAYNRFEDFMTVLRDGAAVYVAGNNSEMANERRFNVMHDNFARRHGVNTASRGFYLDASSSNWDVYRNVSIGCHYPLFSQFHVPSQYTWHCHWYENYIDRPVDAGNHAPWRDTILGVTYDDVADDAAMFEKYPEAREIYERSGSSLLLS